MSNDDFSMPNNEPETVDTQKSTRKIKSRFSIILIILFILVNLGFSVFIYLDKEKQIAEIRTGFLEELAQIETRLQDTLYELKNPDIDLNAKAYQPFSDGYGILIQEIETLPKGKKIIGRIVNFDSVTVSEVELTFTIGANSKDFVVDEIRPGSSRKFEVTVEGSDALSMDIAKVIWHSNKFY